MFWTGQLYHPMMSSLISSPYEGTVGGEMKQMKHATYYSKQHKELYQLTMSTI
jgi:hypothetical protein